MCGPLVGATRSRCNEKLKKTSKILLCKYTALLVATFAKKEDMKKVFVAVWYLNEFDWRMDDYIEERHESVPYSNREAAQAHCDHLKEKEGITAHVCEIAVYDEFKTRGKRKN